MFEENGVQIYQGDSREVLRAFPDESVHCCVTSPPYWGLRDYGADRQIGLEESPVKYVSAMREVFAQVRRVLRADGTLWLNMGDSYATGAGRVGECPGGGEQGKRWKGKQNDAKGRGTPKRADGTGGARYYGPMQQPNRMPIAGLKPKDLVGVPWLLAFALREDGWYLRQDIIWAKPNPMPESVTDRCTKAHEYIFLLSKSERYYYNQEAISEPCIMGNNGSSFTSEQDVLTKPNLGRGPRAERRAAGKWSGEGPQSFGRRITDNVARARGNGADHDNPFGTTRNKRSVWEVTTKPFPEAHFATFPQDLIKPCILAGCPEGGTVLDPFMGSGTTGLVAKSLHCKAIGVELNPDYIKICEQRLAQNVLEFV